MSEVNFECVRSIEPTAMPASTAPTSTNAITTTSTPTTVATTAAAVTSQQSLKNSKDAYLEAARILLVLLENVLSDPANPKYRTIRLENKTIKEKLLSLEGIVQLLSAIGFRRNTADYSLPQEVPLQRVQQYRDVLRERREAWLKGTPPSGNTTLQRTATVNSSEMAPPATKVPAAVQVITPSVPYHRRIAFPRILPIPNAFLQTLERQSDEVMQYEDKQLLAAGRSLIPVDEITQKASERLVAIQERISTGHYTDKEPCIRDLILVELVNWFNTEFFEWVNNLPCKVCGSEESKLRRTQTEGDLRVEVGICCGQETKFYRYNDVAQLLVSRKGRCGEYANCFTFLCRCLDYEARLVLPRFDHVWTEVFSESQMRWLHVDPSDNVVDSPLMYQHGWKRHIDYIIAYSCDDIQDVTWRYTNGHKEILQARKLCTEDELVSAIIAIRNKRQMNLSADRVKVLSQRAMLELCEMTLERNPTEAELKGRSSGSLAWRQSRGEHNFNNIFIFTPNEKEVECKQFNVRYSCARDVYERYLKVSSSDINILETYKTWQSAQFSSVNIHRKVERDWKMVYLARDEGTNNAEIVWKFDFSSANLKVKSHTLRFERKAFGEGQICLSVAAADGNTNIDGASVFHIKAKLSGGKGDVAWQHAQLFRQSLSSHDCPFELEIALV